MQLEVDGAAAGHVARPDHHVVAVEALQQVGDVAGVVREIGVHGADRIEAQFGCPADAGDVRGAQAQLGRPVHHVQAGFHRGLGVEQRAGAVRRVVVDDHAVGTHRQREDLPHQPDDVLAFVVRRNDDGRIRAGMAARRRAMRSPSPRSPGLLWPAPRRIKTLSRVVGLSRAGGSATVRPPSLATSSFVTSNT